MTRLPSTDRVFLCGPCADDAITIRDNGSPNFAKMIARIVAKLKAGN